MSGAARTLGAILALAVAAAPPTVGQQRPLSQAAAAPPARLALLVGIDRYQQPDHGEWKALSGCENDMELVAAMLQERFGFQPADIVTLRTKEATHERIVREFCDHLIARAGKDTQVVFWFSGHGSQTTDRSQRDLAPTEDYTPAQDQTLLAHDSRKGPRNGSYDITDDEMFTLLSALKSRSILYVTDCCHSGGMLRGDGAPGTRGVADGAEDADAALLQSFWPKGLDILEDDAAGAAPPNVVHIAACCAKQEAGELRAPNGKVHGTLTYCLVETLLQCPKDASWLAVVEQVRARIGGTLGTRPDQTVQAHGEATRAVFGGMGAPIPQGYRVERTAKRDGGDLLRIGGGRIHGLVPETMLDLVDVTGKVRARARVDEVRTNHATAWLVRSPWPEVALWAKPESLGGLSPLLVALGPEVPASALDGIGFAKAASAAESADCRIVRGQSGLELADRDGRPIRVDGASTLRERLRREQRYRSLYEIVGNRGPWPIRLEVVAPTPDELTFAKKGQQAVTLQAASVAQEAGADLCRVQAREQSPDQPFSGDLIVLQATNSSDEDLHLALLSVQEDRTISILFGKSSNNILRAGETRRQRILVGPPSDWPGDRPMRDRLIAVATAGHVDWSDYEQDAATVATRGDGGLGPSPFSRLLGQATRGSNDNPWGVAFVDLEVHRR